MESDITSTLVALVAPTDPISLTEAAQQIVVIGIDYAENRSRLPDSEKEAEQVSYGPCTPGIPEYIWCLWELVIVRVKNAPIDEQACHEHITRLVELVGILKKTSHPESDGWLLPEGQFKWSNLPDLGSTIREAYNAPIQAIHFFNPASLASAECQAAIAGIYQPDPQDTESAPARLAKERHAWLSLQHFISRLWRDCGCDVYSLYAIWATRAGLEDWPNASRTVRQTLLEIEESPAYLAFQVEAAAIWISNTARLMYNCTEIWGPKGNPDWSPMEGAPGRGGGRWDGVDGYDGEHKRWKLWKDVLGEVIKWCDDGHAPGWKVKGAAIRALEAMKEVEGH